MALTFQGGVHPDENKETRSLPIEDMPEPLTVSIPMSQHIGTPCVPLVKAGDSVLMGQLIGDGRDGLSCPVHASVSGTVKAVQERIGQNGLRSLYVVIENDFQYRPAETAVPFRKKITDASPEEIAGEIRRAGIVGLGGAAFPTHAKILSALGKAEKLIVNCCECEPYLTANHRLLLEHPGEVINGIKILLAGMRIKEAVIAVEDNKPDAARALQKLLTDNRMIRVAVLKSKYPQGDERQLIYAIDRIRVPAGKLPPDVGRVVFNAETCYAIYRAFLTGMPLIRRVITVGGDCVVTPKNLRVAIGTSFEDALHYCGGFSAEPERIISGGLMMGTAQWDITTPVVKGTTAILAMKKNAGQEKAEAVCIHCGKCVAACPMRLMPLYLAAFSKNNEPERCRAYGIASCMECGCCSYLCPGGVPIVQLIRSAKDILRRG